MHADLAAHVDVVADDAVLGGAARALGGRGEALLAQELDGLVHVAAGFGQRGLAVHHPRAGLVAQLLHLFAVIAISVSGTGSEADRAQGARCRDPRSEMLLNESCDT